MARRLVHVLVIVLTLVVGAAAAAIIVSQTAWFKNWLRGYIVAESARYLNGRLSIERLGGNLFFGVEMENVGISMDGTEVVAIEDLGLDYNVFQMIARGVSIDDIRLNRPVLYLKRDGETWSIARLIKKQEQEADREGPSSPIAIDNIAVTDASVVLEGPVGTSGVDVPDRFDRIDANLSFRYEPVHYSVEISQVTFRGSEPAIGLNGLSGHVSVRDDTVFIENLALRTEESALRVEGSIEHYLDKPVFKVEASSEKVSLPEIARLVPALSGVLLQPAFELKVHGPMDWLGVEMNVRSSAGKVTGRLTADVMMPGQSVAGDVTVHSLNLAPILKDPAQKTDLNGRASIDVTAERFTNIDSIKGSVTIDAPRVTAAGYTAERVIASADLNHGRAAINAKASAYGAAATARGRVTLPSGARPLAYDLRGDVRNVDLRRLPRSLNVPPAETNVNATYHVVGSEPGAVVSGFSRTRNVRLETAFRESTVAGAAIAPGSTVNATIDGRQVAYQAEISAKGVDLQRIGREFNVPALAVERYRTEINARIAGEGEGTDPKTMTVAARGELAESTILGGRIPQLTFDANLAGDTLNAKAVGSLRWIRSRRDQRPRRGQGRRRGTAGRRGNRQERVGRRQPGQR